MRRFRPVRAICGSFPPPQIERAAPIRRAQTLAAAVELYDSGEYSAAQATLARLQPSPALLDYVEYYRGLAQLRLKQYPEARRTLEALVARKPVGRDLTERGAGAR